MSTLSLRLPESIHQKLGEIAKREGVSVNQLISLAVAEKRSALMTEEYLAERAGRASEERFRAVLAKSPAVPLKSTSIPLNSTSIPLESTSIPLESTSIPLESTSIPLKSTSIPLKSTSIPLKRVVANVGQSLESGQGCSDWPRCAPVRHGASGRPRLSLWRGPWFKLTGVLERS